jgi:hypothetical protein
MANFSVRTGLEIGPNQKAQVVVKTVRPGTASARAGIEAGDIITKVNGVDVVTIGEFQRFLLQKPSQPAFFLTLERSDHSFRVPVGRQLPLLGMTVFPDAADRPTVVDVDSSSPARFAGFQTGDLIIGVGHRMALTMDRLLDFGIPFIRGVPMGQGIAFLVSREGKTLQLSITRPADSELPPLTPDQERHLRRLGRGPAEPPPRRVMSQSTTSMTQTRAPELIDSATNPVAPVPAYTGTSTAEYRAGVIGSDVLGLGLPTGSARDVGSAGPNETSPREFGPVQNASAAVAVLYGMPSNLVRQALTPDQRAQSVSVVTASTPMLNAGVLGFVQIQTLSTFRENQRAKPAQQSLVNARIAGAPAGIFTLVVNQYGDSGDITSASAGPAAIGLGKIVVDENGQGALQTRVSYSPQAFLGRVVSLVPVGVFSPAVPQGSPPDPEAAARASANIVASGVFGLSNPRRPLIGANAPFGPRPTAAPSALSQPLSP